MDAPPHFHVAALAIIIYTAVRYATSPPEPGKLAVFTLAALAAIIITWIFWTYMTWTRRRHNRRFLPDDPCIHHRDHDHDDDNDAATS